MTWLCTCPRIKSNLNLGPCTVTFKKRGYKPTVYTRPLSCRENGENSSTADAKKIVVVLDLQTE